MAKIYIGGSNDRTNAALNKTLFPQSNAPLDTRDVFYSLEDFKAYVRQDTTYAPAGYDAADIQFLHDIAPYSYAGQVVAVVSGDATTLYKIDKVGGDVEGVNYSAIGGDVAADLGALTGRVGTLETTVSAIPSTYQTQAIPSIEGYASASLTVEGALAEVMSKAMSNAGGITAVEGRVATAEASIKAMQPVLDAVPSTYATKSEVNALSTVYETIDNVSSKLANYYTSAQTDAKFETIANVNSKLANYYTKEQADEKHEEVVKVAEGKTNTYILSYNETIETLKEKLKISTEDKVYDADGNDITAGVKNGDYDSYRIVNNIFSSDSEVVYEVMGYFITFNNITGAHEGELHGSSYAILPLPQIAKKLKTGDILYITEVDVPDRWYAGGATPAMFYKMETSKVDLEPYAKTEYVDKAVDGINDSLASYATIDYVDGKVEEINGNIQAIEAWAASSISVEDIEKWNKAEENAHNSAVASASAMVAEEASIRANADDALSARIDAEVSARISGDNALSGRLDLIEAKPFDTYASISYVDAEISKVAAAATKVEKSNVNGNILVDGAEVVVYDDEALAERVTNAEASIGTNAEAIALNAQHFTELQGTVTSIDTRVTNLETTVEGIPSTYATKEELSTEANTRAEEDGKLATRLSLVEESLGLRDPEDPENPEGDNKGIAEQIAAIKAEIWGTADMSASSRIDKLEMADIVIGQKIDGINSKLNANLLSTVSGGQYVSGSISGNNLTFDDHLLVSAIDGLTSQIGSMASNPVTSVSISGNNLEVAYHSGGTVSYNLIEGVFGTSSIASNAVYLVSKDAKVSVLNELADNLSVSATEINTAATWVSYNMGVVSNLASNAVTSVQTSTLVMSHSGNNLMINLPSVIWLDGGSASDTYEAEEAVYNELLNNEYGN